MADLISSSIVDGGTVEASQITALYDTFTGTTTYDNISIVGTASYSTTASHALNGGGSSINTGSFLITASVSNDTITFTKGNTSTFNIEVDNVTSASYASTASFVTTAQTASFVTTAQTASFVTTAQTASFVTTAQTASFVTTALSSSVSTTAQTASFVTTALSSSVSTTAQTASVMEPVLVEISGASPISLGLKVLVVGSIFLASGSGNSSYIPTLNGLTNGTDCFIFINAFTSAAPGENYEAAIQSSGGNGRVVVTDPAGSSNARVSFIVFSLA